MRKKMMKAGISLLIVFLFTEGSVFSGKAATGGAALQGFQNPDTGYRVVIEDDADLLTRQEEADLEKEMREITEYGNAVFVTVEENDFTAEYYAGAFFSNAFGTDSGVLLLIDMDNHMIWIHSDGGLYQVMTEENAETVTDNVYRYASKEEFYTCASEAFAQINALLKGQKIARPMKYISNLLLAVSLALLMNFGLMIAMTRVRKQSERELLLAAQRSFSCTEPEVVFTNQTRAYDPVSSGSGSSGGHSGGGSHRGGGGGRSGGGGGHRF